MLKQTALSFGLLAKISDPGRLKVFEALLAISCGLEWKLFLRLDKGQLQMSRVSPSLREFVQNIHEDLLLLVRPTI